MTVADGSDLNEITDDFIIDEIFAHGEAQDTWYGQLIASKSHLREKKQIGLEPVKIVKETAGSGGASVFQILRFRPDICSGIG